MKRPREKNERHLKFIRSLPCAVCGNNIETEAAHLRAGNLAYGKRNTGIGEKPSDKWVIPLCGIHHRKQHGISEQAFWVAQGINPWDLAQKLYRVSGNHEAGEKVIGGRT